MNRSEFFAELKRRRVFRVAAAYAVTAFVIAQVADIFFPGLGLPDWALRLVLVLLIFGFPVALVLAWAFDITPEGVVRTEALPPGGEGNDAAPARFSRRHVAIGITGAALLVLVMGATALSLWERGAHARAAGVDSGVVAVVPFRVAADPSLAYLREGMLDLLAAKLTGEGGLRAADPRTVMSAWRGVAGDGGDLPQQEALSLAQRLGAGQLLVGGVVGTPARLTLNASVLSVPDGRVQAQATVEGPHDSLTVLVDQLAASLLSLSAGEERQRLSHLTSASLPALQAYLSGRSAYRQGRYEEALQEFTRALDIDSTFALAGLSLRQTAGWLGGAGQASARGQRLALAAIERLGTRDRAIVVATFGSPDRTAPRSGVEWLGHIEEALETVPDSPELWHDLGDVIFHLGAVLGLSRAEERHDAAFRRSLDLDEHFASSLHHTVQHAARVGDLATARELAGRYLARDDTGETADHIRWRLAVATGGGMELERIRAGMDSMSTSTLRWIAVSAQDDGVTIADAYRAARIRRDRAGTHAEQFERRLGVHGYALNGGRPSEALRITEEIREVQSDPHFHLRLRVLTALYSDADEDAARAAAHQLAALSDPLYASPDNAAQGDDLCVLEQWRLWQGDGEGTRGVIERIREITAPESNLRARTCIALLTALSGVGENRPDAAAAIARLDSLLLSGIQTSTTDDGHLDYYNLSLARLQELQGNRTAALDALRRRPYFFGWQQYLSSYLREEGRLAALTGDREGAIRAYRHYLAFRYDPDPALRAEVERVRSELARLERQGG